MFWNKNEKKERVCTSCGYVGRQFFKRQTTTGAAGMTWKVTLYRCPECGSDNVKPKDEILNKMIEERYSDAAPFMPLPENYRETIEKMSEELEEEKKQNKIKSELSELGYNNAEIKKILKGEAF